MREAPAVAGAQQAFGDDVTFIGIPGKAELGEMQAFVSDNGVSAFEHAVDDDGTLWRTLGVTTQPSFVFVNDDGTVEAHRGALGEQGLADKISALQSS